MQAEYLSPKEAAAVAGVSVRTIHNWITSGQLRVIRKGLRTFRIPADQLDDFTQRGPALATLIKARKALVDEILAHTPRSLPVVDDAHLLYADAVLPSHSGVRGDAYRALSLPVIGDAARALEAVQFCEDSVRKELTFTYSPLIATLQKVAHSPAAITGGPDGALAAALSDVWGLHRA